MGNVNKIAWRTKRSKFYDSNLWVLNNSFKHKLLDFGNSVLIKFISISHHDSR